MLILEKSKPPLGVTLAALLLAFVGTAFGGTTNEAPAPDPTVGDTWTYRAIDLFSGAEVDRYSLQFIRRESTSLVMRSTKLASHASKIIRPTAELGRCSRSKDIAEVSCGSPLKFPLRVGEHGGYDHLPNPGGYGYSGVDCKVEGVERVSVPAGTFDAFHVECLGRWTSNGGELDGVLQGRIQDSYWYAPSVNQNVKFIYRASGYKGGPFLLREVELVAFAAAAPIGATADPAIEVGANLGVASTSATEFMSGTTRFIGSFAIGPARRGYSGNGHVAWGNGDAYEGTLVDGAREGKGKFTWASGQVFEGDWHSDSPNGRGRLAFANGDVYEGVLVDGIPTGSGAMAYASGDRYSGEFAAGVPNGHGRYVWQSGQTLDGDWLSGQGKGNGTLRFANGDVYEGTLVAGKPDGPGRMAYASGDVYEGEFADGLPSGQGRYVWREGGEYVGAWKGGKKNGRGVLTWATHQRWQGLFVEDERTEGDFLK